jgi:hypothetical protein
MPPSLAHRGMRLLWMAFYTAIQPTLVAQINPSEPQRHHFWTPMGMVLYSPETHSFLQFDRKQKVSEAPRKRVGLGSEFRPVGFLQNKFWSTNIVRYAKPGEEPIKAILSTTDGARWDQEGWIKPNRDLDARYVYPLGGDRFLLVAMQRLIWNGKSSQFAYARRDPATLELKVQDTLDMGLEKPWGVPFAKGSFASALGINPAYTELLVSEFRVIQSQRHVLIVAMRPGYLWLLDAEAESPRMKPIRLFENVLEKYLDGEQTLERGVLDAHVTPQGTFLFATRTERAVVFGALKQPRLKDPSDLKNPALMQDRETIQRLSVLDEPDLLWWELDPFEGKVHPFPTPVGVADRFTAVEEIRRFRFWFEPDGSLKCTLTAASAPSQPVKVKPKAAPR